MISLHCRLHERTPQAREAGGGRVEWEDRRSTGSTCFAADTEQDVSRARAFAVRRRRTHRSRLALQETRELVAADAERARGRRLIAVAALENRDGVAPLRFFERETRRNRDAIAGHDRNLRTRAERGHADHGVTDRGHHAGRAAFETEVAHVDLVALREHDRALDRVL